MMKLAYVQLKDNSSLAGLCGGLMQCVLGNVYVSNATATGQKTFHAMGGITVMTPPFQAGSIPLQHLVTVEAALVIGSEPHWV